MFLLSRGCLCLIFAMHRVALWSMIMATHLFPSSPFYTALLELFAIRLMILRKPISFTESHLDACIANIIYHTEKMEQVIVRIINVFFL